MDPRIMDKIAKVKALADRGVRGEKEAAEVLLAKLLTKYNIDESDLLDDVVKEFEFQAYGVFGTQLFSQICYTVVGTNVSVLYYKNMRNCKTRFVRCTEAQFVEISEMFEFYRHILDDGLESYYEAFIQAESLFAKDAEPTELSYQETLDWVNSEAYRLSRTMRKHDRNLKKLESGEV